MSESLSPSDPSVLVAVQAALGTGFVIEREIGGGGMSRVFVATETALARRVAVKVLSPELFQGMSAERFAREVALAAQLQDPHIVPVLTAGATADGLPWYTMPFIEGESLRARMLRGPVPLDEALRILRDVAEALEYAHRRGVVHRDIKPENILIAGRSAVVADFGIAKAITAARADTGERAASVTLTSVGMSLGTPAYMAPEQAAGDPTDHRADLYAWGMVAYELLAGAHPFAHKDGMQQLIAAQIAEMPRALDDLRPGLPAPLGALVMQCLEKAAAERPADATAVLAALSGAVSGSVTVGRTGSVPAAAPSRSRRGGLLAVVGGLAVLAVAGVAIAGKGGSARGAPALDDAPSLAVLPFEHQGDSSDVYLTEGITDEIRGKLTGVRDLIVIARTSSNGYRKTTKSPKQIAEELGVRYLLTGTVRVVRTGADRRVLVRPELVEITSAGQPQSRWAKPFDVSGADVLGVQGQVAEQVVTALEVPVAGGADRSAVAVPSTRDAQAYDLFLRGRAAIAFGANQSPPALRAAIALFERAVARDSQFVDAWAGLAVMQGNLYSTQPSAALAAAVRKAAERTLALDPDGAQGAKAMGVYHLLVEGDAVASVAASERAMRANPGDVSVANNLALALFDLGRADEALRVLASARRRDPRHAGLASNSALFLLLTGRLDEARVMVERLRVLNPLSPRTLHRRLQVELFAGDTAAAKRILAEALGGADDDGLVTALITEDDVAWLFDPARVRRALARGPEPYGGERSRWLLLQAQWARAAGDSAGQRAWADSARRAIAREVEALRKDQSLRLNYALAHALAERREEALRIAREAITSLAADRATSTGTSYLNALLIAASAAVLAGDHAQALEWLELQAKFPLRMSPGYLRVHPWFAPLRGDPRFNRLTAP